MTYHNFMQSLQWPSKTFFFLDLNDIERFWYAIAFHSLYMLLALSSIFPVRLKRFFDLSTTDE
jgi:hypothetical protein